MTYLLYQSYGSNEIAGEALFSIFSLLKIGIPEDVKIALYTDRAEFYEKYLPAALPIDYIRINRQQIRQWGGAIDFVHRVKVEIMMDFFQKHPSDNLLYMDSDTWFLKSPMALIEEIRNGKIFMHIAEGAIESKQNSIFRKVYKFLKKNEFILGGTPVKIPLSIQMWNAGVIGIPAQCRHLLKEVLSLTDQMYSRYSKHIMEQLAFSYILSQQFSIHAADGVVYHYWDFKAYRNIIATFLAGNQDVFGEGIIRKAAEIAPFELSRDKSKKRKLTRRIFGG